MISLTKCLKILDMGMRRNQFRMKTRMKIRKKSCIILRMMCSSLLTSEEVIRKLRMRAMVKTLKSLTALQLMESRKRLNKLTKEGQVEGLRPTHMMK